jgi:CRP-like cAMP-binding protein
MQAEKEKIHLKPFKLLDQGQQGGVLTLVERSGKFQLTALQFAYLKVLQNGTSIEELVGFYLANGWLVSFRELFSLIEFLVQQEIILNPSVKEYFRNCDELSKTFESLQMQKSMSGGQSLQQKSKAKLTQVEISRLAMELPFFRSLDKSLSALLLEEAEILEVSAQTMLTKVGARERDLFIILKGQAAIYRVFGPNQRQLIASLGPGSLFGERGFLLDQPRSADIITKTDCEVLRVRHHPEQDQWIKKDKANSIQYRFWLMNAFMVSPIFQNLPGDTIDALIFSGRLSQAPENFVLFQQGQPGTTCYILIQGSVLVVQDGRTVNVLNQGSCFGEIALIFNGGMRSTTVSTQRDCVFLEIAQKDFYRILSQNLFLAKEIESLAAQRLTNDASRIQK